MLALAMPLQSQTECSGRKGSAANMAQDDVCRSSDDAAVDTAPKVATWDSSAAASKAAKLKAITTTQQLHPQAQEEQQCTHEQMQQEEGNTQRQPTQEQLQDWALPSCFGCAPRVLQRRSSEHGCTLGPGCCSTTAEHVHSRSPAGAHKSPGVAPAKAKARRAAVVLALLAMGASLLFFDSSATGGGWPMLPPLLNGAAPSGAAPIAGLNSVPQELSLHVAPPGDGRSRDIPPQSLTATLDALPAVPLPTAAPNAAAAHLRGEQDPIRALDLDCSSGGTDDTSCAGVAAATNSYEFEEDALDATELKAYLEGWKAHAVEAEVTAAAAPAIAGGVLFEAPALDCEAEPAECDRAAVASNSYEYSDPTAAATAEAEARRYLDTLSATLRGGGAAAEGSLLVNALFLDCASASDAAACVEAGPQSNLYEALSDHPLDATRVTEAAAPAARRPYVLALDCWGPGGDGAVDAATAAECERSRASNSYEEEVPEAEAEPQELAAAHGTAGPRGHGHGGSCGTHGHDAEVPPLQVGPDGLPTSGSVQGYYSWFDGALHGGAAATQARAAASAASSATGARFPAEPHATAEEVRPGRGGAGAAAEQLELNWVRA
jgi:hypothetical protein